MDTGSQVAFARRRCRACGFPCMVVSGVRHGYLYRCKACGAKHLYTRRRDLLRWTFLITFYSFLFTRRDRTRSRRLTALVVLRPINESGLRERILRMAGLW